MERLTDDELAFYDARLIAAEILSGEKADDPLYIPAIERVCPLFFLEEFILWKSLRSSLQCVYHVS